MSTTTPDPMEAARLAHIADVQAIQQNLATLPNAELMMLALGEIIAFMPKADAGADGARDAAGEGAHTEAVDAQARRYSSRAAAAV